MFRKAMAFSMHITIFAVNLKQMVMPTHSFKAAYNTGESCINLVLGVYIFTEEGIYIAYCPALDISGYGENEQEAKQSFGEVVRQYLDYCIHEHTLTEDLQKHGWKVESIKQHKFKSPDTVSMMKKNPDFKNLIENKEYSKYMENLSIPSFA